MRHNFGYFEDDRGAGITEARLWRRIMVYVRPQWRSIVIAIILTQVVVAASLTLPWLVREALDRFITATGITTAVRFAGLERLALVFLVLALIAFIANFFQVVILERSGQEIMHRLRHDIFAHLLGLDLAFYDKNPVGRLVTRLSNDIQNMHEMFTSVIVSLFNDILRMTVILVLLFIMNPLLAAIMLALLPVLVVIIALFSRLARRVFRDIRTAIAGLNAFIQESVNGMNVIRIFAAEGRNRKRFSRLNADFCRRNLRQIGIFAFFMPLIELCATVAVALIIWYGGGRVMRGMMTIGTLAAFLHYIRLFFQPVRELSQKYSIVQSAMASAERLFAILDTVPGITPAGSCTITAPAGAVEFSKVTFAYGDNPPVLQDFSLTIKAGETVAVVGATGSGKTTLINLIERFYQPRTGEIRIDGVNVGDIDPGLLSRYLGLVLQEVILLPATVRENITLGREVDDALLARVVEQAQLLPLLATMPQGLETRVGLGGRVLSVGEEQLLALARALAGDPRIFLLDEATASIDSATEILIERAIANTIADRTAIVVAHRLSTVRHADRILVMDQGKIIESGSHDELMAKGGRYAALIAGDRFCVSAP